jgi:predicted phosphate transport protein (TIGR00153 family)
MAELKISPFRTTKLLRNQIDELLDVVSDAAIAYKQGMNHAVRSGWDDDAERKFEQISKFETRGDQLRDAIGQSLFTEMLLPDRSGDVLGLLSSLDRLLDEMEHSFLAMRIERPDIPADLHERWLECVALVADTMEQVVLAARSYFRDPYTARDHIHKIHFYEKETQRNALQLMEQVFQSDLQLDRKMLIRGHIWLMHRLADIADNAGDALAIYAVKRSG